MPVCFCFVEFFALFCFGVSDAPVPLLGEIFALFYLGVNDTPILLPEISLYFALR